MRYQWRPMRAEDLPHVMAIAEQVHVGYFEAEEVFAERLALFASGCLIAVRREGAGAAEVIGYAFMHPARQGFPPALNTFLGRLDPAADCLHLHDVALLPAARGSGLGRHLVEALSELCQTHGLPKAALVAVHGSSGYWRAAGFLDDAQVSVQGREHLASYGEDALYMTKNLNG
ncbi:GNAT family N-acetyltransferase [Herbaspirillum huttiense]|uniref:GNAT family N-acetyltransferase n=1 Tax=Herbaspirillum huttiense TaxID=863372 RepID=UPI0039B10D9D